MEELFETPSDPRLALEDSARLDALRRTHLLDTPPEAMFDQVSRLAARLLDAPVALISLVDRDRQFLKSCLGLPTPWADTRETPLSHSFCQYVVADEQPLRVDDARIHPVLQANLAIRDLNVIAYLGVPLRSPEDQVIGSLCVIDSKPRPWTDGDLETLEALALSVGSMIRLRAEVLAAARTTPDEEVGDASVEEVLSDWTTRDEVCEAAGRLWEATTLLLGSLDAYDHLIRRYDPSQDVHDEERRLRTTIRSASDRMRVDLGTFTECLARLREAEDAKVGAGRALADAIRGYFEADAERAAASTRFQQLQGPLDDVERAASLVSRAEARLREAMDAFEVAR